MGRTTNFLVGILSGAIAGAVGALLFTPYSGRELQARAREQFDNLVDDARYAAQAKRIELETQLEALKAPKETEREKEREQEPAI